MGPYTGPISQRNGGPSQSTPQTGGPAGSQLEREDSLLNKAVGDEVILKLPAVTRRLKVVELQTIH